ncbi:MAG: hypothetical protein QXF14_02350, partial [Candidatus Woesearchaeota archaeon]
MISKYVLRGLGITLVIFGVFASTEWMLALIKSLINPATVIRPEWVQDLARIKIVSVIAGILLFAATFITLTFKKSKAQINKPLHLQEFVLVMLLLAFIAGSYWAFRPIEVNVGSLYVDDFFYFLKIAENVPKYGKVTFDGINPTNGFQPLWFLVLTLLTILIPNQIVLFTIATLILMLAHVLTAYVLYRICAGYGYELTGAVLALFWGFNPFLLWAAASGFETGLYLLLLSLSVWYYFSHRESLKQKQSALLGLLLGLTLLARLDSIFFAVAVAADYLFLNKKKFGSAFRQLVPCGIVLAIFAAAWSIFSLINSKALMPLSGASKALASNAGYYTGFMDLIIKRAFTTLALIKEGTKFIGLSYLQGFVYGVAIAAILGIALILLAKKTCTKIRDFAFIILFCIMLFGYYISTGAVMRYLMPIVMFIILGSALVLVRAYYASSAKNLLRVVYSAVGLLIAVSLVFSSVQAARTGQLSSEWTPLQYTMYEDGIRWIRNNTSPDTIIGAFNAGVYGYFSGRKIVNLDGVINDNAYYALKDKRLYSYINEQNISYIIDWDYVEDYYFKRFGGDANMSAHLTRVAVLTKKDEP